MKKGFIKCRYTESGGAQNFSFSAILSKFPLRGCYSGAQSLLFSDRLRCRVKTPRHDGIIQAGFTLIELLVVVLIIGILSAVALPQYTKAVEKSRVSDAKILLKALSDAEDVYVLQTGDPCGTINLELRCLAL